MYFTLRCEYPVDENGGYYDIDDGLQFDGVGNWAVGRPFTKPPPDPMVVPIEAIDGYQGEPPEMVDGNICFFSRRMVDVLRAAGVDNLDCYPAILRDQENGRDFPRLAGNILGLVAAADLKSSEWENLDGAPKLDTHFDRLVVDDGAARGLLMFRLAESTGTIVVHEKVKLALERAGLSMLQFLPAR
jgi:hypothetical protein